MRFRFTLQYPGAQSGPISLPSLEQWSTQTGADNEWSEGPVPSVNLPAVFPTIEESEYLYVDYGFEDGVEYTITLTHTTTYNSGSQNPRTVTLAILDNSFVSQFTEVDTFPPSPGGQDSITIQFTANTSCTKIGFKASSGSDVTIVVDEVSGTSSDPTDLPDSLEINEPDGWKQAVMKLARDEDFHSLIEFFDGSFIFYGDNGTVNGGIHFIEFYEVTKGVDVTLNLLIEIAPDDLTYETCFEGQLDLSNAERLPRNKYRIPVIRDDFWAKFYARWKTPVDLQAAADLDGTPITSVVEPGELSLTDQKITYFSEYNWLYTMTYPDESGDPSLTYLMLAFDEEIRSDIKLFSLARQATDTDGSMIFGLFEAPWDGDYTVEIRLITSTYDDPSIPGEWAGISTTRLRIRKTNQSSVEISQFTGGINNGTDTAEIIDYKQVWTLSRGEQLSIMLHRATSGRPVTVFGKEQITWLEVDLATVDSTIVLSGEQTIDGTLTATSRVLVKNQGNTYENGIYVSAAGAWTRATDMDTADEFNDVAVYVSGGTDQTGTAWRQTQEVVTVGTDGVAFVFTEPSDEWQKAFPEAYDISEYNIIDQIFDYIPDHPGSFIKITANTVYRTTSSPGFLIHDAAAAIIKSYGLGEPNPFYSELLGSTFTNARMYENDGCAWRYFLLRGLHVRGYTLAEKPFSLSLEQWWKGADPIFCLGLSYDLIEGSTVDPDTLAVQDLPDWDDAGGTFPGAWNYAVFAFPFTSVNGDGGTEGYTCGLWPAVSGTTYVLTTIVEIFETGSNPTNITLIWAALDASFNEIVTEELTYTSDGFKAETFNLTPSSDATYLAVRVINNTVSDTKSLVIRMAKGETVTQLLSNSEFSSSSDWTNEGAGTDWVITGGEATLSLASGLSKALTQEFAGGDVGDYSFIGEFTVSGIAGGDQMELTVNFYDSGNNLIETKTELLFVNETSPWNHEFTSVVAIAKVEFIAEVTVGTDIDLSVPFAGLYLVVPTEAEIIPDMRVIRVEEREFFYQEEMSVLISNIEEITRKYDTEKIYNKIEIGYSQWQSEDVSGIDDPQTKHIYSTRFQKIGEGITIHSDFIAASLALETTRRQTIEKSTDYKFDNNTFIVAIETSDVSPDSYVPELGSSFSSILNLLNSDTRYNVRLSVARNFLRWRKWLNGCLQSYLSSFYKFVSGEGNFDMVTTFDQSPDCLGEDNEGQSLSEKQDIDVTDEVIHTTHYYEMDVPMEWETYKTIRENRRNAIGISLTDTDHVPLFIEGLEYQVMEGKAKITGWTKEYFPLEVIEGPAATQDCQPTTICENPLTDEFGEPLTDENGVCITAGEDEEGIFDDTFDDTFE